MSHSSLILLIILDFLLSFSYFVISVAMSSSSSIICAAISSQPSIASRGFFISDIILSSGILVSSFLDLFYIFHVSIQHAQFFTELINHVEYSYDNQLYITVNFNICFLICFFFKAEVASICFTFILFSVNG